MKTEYSQLNIWAKTPGRPDPPPPPPPDPDAPKPKLK
jgi:hypothetical protein